MADQHFKLAFIPDRYADRVQRLAVLYPLTKPCYTPQAIYAQVDRLITMWRARISALTNCGWSPRPGHHSILYARNCCPSFAYATARTRCCGHRSLCPFCYARWVRGVWLSVDRAFPNPHDDAERRVEGEPEITLDWDVPDRHYQPGAEAMSNNPSFRYHLIERHHRAYVPYEPAQEGFDQLTWIQGIMRSVVMQRSAMIKTLTPAGAFFLTTLEPSTHGWKLRHRQLFKVPANYRLPPTVSENTRGVIRYHTAPSRKVVFSAVGRVCRYPVQLIRGDVEQTLRLLLARQSCGAHPPRMSAMFGGFREGRYGGA